MAVLAHTPVLTVVLTPTRRLLNDLRPLFNGGKLAECERHGYSKVQPCKLGG
jgi:hypothetical protein